LTPGATRLIWDRALNLTSSVMVSRNLPKGGTPWYSWNIAKVGVKHQSIKIRQKFKLQSLTPIGTHRVCFNRVWWEWSFFSRYCSRMFDESTLHQECTLILNINNRILLTIILSPYHKWLCTIRINQFNPTTLLYLSQARTWISNIMCCGLLLSLCWPSLFKLSLGERWLFVLVILVELLTITL
jgi:hypothetical protein